MGRVRALNFTKLASYFEALQAKRVMTIRSVLKSKIPRRPSFQGACLSPRDTRHASHNSHTGDVHAQIDRGQSHKSLATKGSMPCRPHAAPQHHRRTLRNRKTPAD